MNIGQPLSTSITASTPITQIGLSVRASNALCRSGIFTIGALLQKSRNDIAKMKHVGIVTISDIETILAQYSLSLKNEGNCDPVTDSITPSSTSSKDTTPMVLVGSLCITATQKIFLRDYAFVHEDGTEMSDKDLKEWALWLNSPWSVVDQSYVIEWNHGRKGADALNRWRTMMSVIGYDGCEATCTGYGSSPQGSFTACTNFFASLQQKYNPENESI